MVQQSNLVRHWRTVRKNWPVMAVVTVIALLTSYMLTFFLIHPVYEASSTVIVGKSDGNPGDKSLDYSSVLANQQLAKTYEAVATSRTVLERVVSLVGTGLSLKDLRRQVKVNVVKGTELIAINVQDGNPDRAAQIANFLTAEFSKRVVEVKKVDSVSLVDSAVPPQEPLKPRKVINMVLAFVIGLSGSVALILFREYLDNTIKTPEEVEILEVPVLGAIPNFN